MTDGSGDLAKKIVAVLGVAAIVVLIAFVMHSSDSSSSKKPQDSIQNQPAPSAASQESSASPKTEMKPQVEDVTIHPYELMKNPFLKKNHMVRLDTHSYPILLDGNLLNY